MKIETEQDEAKKDALLLVVHDLSTRAYADIVLQMGREPEAAVSMIAMAMFEDSAAMAQAHRVAREDFLTAAALCWDEVAAAVREKGAA